MTVWYLCLCLCMQKCADQGGTVWALESILSAEVAFRCSAPAVLGLICSLLKFHFKCYWRSLLHLSKKSGEAGS